MHHWDLVQFFILYAANLVTAASYYVLPVLWWFLEKDSREQGLEVVPIFVTDMYLTRTFVFSCGTHHIVMLPAMWFSRGWDFWFWSLVLVDTLMAGVSAVSAVRAAQQRVRG